MPLTPLNHSLGIPFVELQSIDSTNNYALSQIHAKLAQPGTCYFAHEQTAGKGQRGKHWFSEKGSNITMSIAITPSFLSPVEQFHLSACVAAATCELLSNYAGPEVSIKWPNDLYWRNKKLGGILIENIIGGETDSESATGKQWPAWKWAVIGIGVNINQERFDTDLINPISLTQITNDKHDCVSLAKKTCKTIDLFYKRLMQEGLVPILKLYNAHLYKKDETVRFKKDNRVFDATVKSVDANGRLIIQHSIEEKIDFGQLEWIL